MFTVTDEVLIGNEADVVPAKTVTLAGTIATKELLARVTAIPAAGAGPVSIIVPVEPDPPTTLVGDKASDKAIGAFTVKVAVLAPLKVTVMPTDVFVGTALVVIRNVAVDAPPGTVTAPATDATEGLALATTTEIPSLGAGPVSVTVPLEFAPPRTVVGDNERDNGAGAFTVSVAVFAMLKAAVIPTGVFTETGIVEIGKVAVDAPPVTVTVAGTATTCTLPLVNVTVTPAATAGPDSVTVPVDAFPPTKL